MAKMSRTQAPRLMSEKHESAMFCKLEKNANWDYIREDKIKRVKTRRSTWEKLA